VKDSGNQHTIKLHEDADIACNTNCIIQCSRMLKYSIIIKPYLEAYAAVTDDKNGTQYFHC
jgi:hypothetical protein